MLWESTKEAFSVLINHVKWLSSVFGLWSPDATVFPDWFN
ncbi:MAG: hypothetical protein ACI9FD_001722, partial [Gammaproteobacteria bacterium]